MQCKKCKQDIPEDGTFCPYCGKRQTPKPRKKIKKPNGFGCVVYLGGRRKRPWGLRVTDKIVDGKQIYRYIDYYKTETEALKAQAAEQISPTLPKSDITLEKIFEEWKDTKKYKKLSKQTQDNYNAAYKHLAPLHNERFADLRASHYEKIIDNLERSYSTKHKIKVLLGLLYKYAMKDGDDIVSRNYAEGISLDDEDHKTEKQIFTKEQIKLMEKNVDRLPYLDTILIMIYSGMRISEMLLLTKDSINFEYGTITGGLKTEAGKNRTIPIHPKILPYIEKYYNQAENRLFVDENKKPLNVSHYRSDIYYPLLESLNLPRLTPHSCRHTFATMLAKNGADTLAIQRMIGHTNYAFTANVYTRTDIELLKLAINKI